MLVTPKRTTLELMCQSLGVDALHNSLPAVAGQLGTIKPRSVRRSGTFYHHPGLDTNYGPTHDAETIDLENVSQTDLYLQVSVPLFIPC